MTSEWRSVAPSDEDELVIADLIELFAARVQAGEAIDVDSFAAEHPAYAEKLRELLPGVQVLANLEPSASDSDPGGALTESREGMLSSVLGDFCILREVGKGGMGVVYEAEQISLRRRVALKVLPFAATMDPHHLQRFHNEAQAAACLHHTNIVPVFSVGCERGVHFYAMQFIDGQPLSEIIRQMQRLEKKAPTAGRDGTVAYQPSAGDASTPAPAAELTPLTGEGRRSRDYFRKVAELGIQSAEALDHAHQLGIVHRDIKPANLLLDGRGNLWVTDFGLAHMQRGEASLTMTGQALGTPRYMSPEQALAKRVPIDHRTDVYSLGVTLYELLTLRPAFASEDRHELLRQIAFEEPTRPRRLDSAIPAELEIIVLKAMEKRPQDRYATALGMANDLRHFLEDRPIQAKPPALWQRLVKWSRRHEAVVRSGVAALLLVLVILAVSLALIVRAFRSEAEQRRAAEGKAAEAKALEDYLVNDLLGSAVPEKRLGRKLTVEEILANAEKKLDFAFSGQPNVEAAIRHTLGVIYWKLGKYEAAALHLARARELYESLFGRDCPETLLTMHWQANVLLYLAKREEARRMHEEVLARRRRVLGEDHPDTLSSLHSVGTVLSHEGKEAEARGFLEEAAGRRRLRLGDSHPDTLNSMNNLANVLQGLGEWDGARRMHEELLSIRRRTLGDNHPDTLLDVRR